MLLESQALFSICLVCNNYANSAIITRQLPASILVFGFFWLFLKVSLAFLGPGNLATIDSILLVYYYHKCQRRDDGIMI